MEGTLVNTAKQQVSRELTGFPSRLICHKYLWGYELKSDKARTMSFGKESNHHHPK
jgi:hypothetical protein